MNREPLIFEISSGTKKGFLLPKLDVPEKKEALTGLALREEIGGFPTVSEVEVVRHFTRLSQANFCIDTTLYPLGSCTMKYNPKINEKIAGL
ncbi:MAG: aminomethyl-transferring glycine dehydrogenase subunit GcvPB, partial [Candidatus Aminicenantes bacterium]|nr:aminomethyl-transferring glycine dehydrogenase subunit GcvPB [Candidatus Aminicenantes bacterium]